MGPVTLLDDNFSSGLLHHKHSIEDVSAGGGWGKGWGKVQYIKDGVLISAVIGCCKHSSGILKV